eukprot:CAMPEP_0206505598 /NCGR_PEP_ID=MMETSP0324_2-20121206/56232_1 /ASSEMBLY_ACC=CAM_ASM_000836 /TAXON_ID=2866 /ORGANISM="Crypthecodinium cohnii, Strain Seligo" /LENGTH=129 /DNA_ID=CAMNT_0053995101 /DNA_START=110 /DNA_END=500 /DNA_ORIENTATION=+
MQVDSPSAPQYMGNELCNPQTDSFGQIKSSQNFVASILPDPIRSFAFVQSQSEPRSRSQGGGQARTGLEFGAALLESKPQDELMSCRRLPQHSLGPAQVRREPPHCGCEHFGAAAPSAAVPVLALRDAF